MGDTPSHFNDYSDEQLKQAGRSNDFDYNERQEIEREQQRREKTAEKERQIKQEEEDQQHDEWLQTQKAYEENNRFDSNNVEMEPINKNEDETPSKRATATKYKPAYTPWDGDYVTQIEPDDDFEDDRTAVWQIPTWYQYCMIGFMALDYICNLWMGFAFYFGIQYDNDCDNITSQNILFGHSIAVFLCSFVGVVCGIFGSMKPNCVGVVFVWLKIAFQDIAISSIIFNAMLRTAPFIQPDLVSVVSIIMCTCNVILCSCTKRNDPVCGCCLCVPVLVLCCMLINAGLNDYYYYYEEGTLLGEYFRPVKYNVPNIRYEDAVYSWTIDGVCAAAFDTTDLKDEATNCKTIGEAKYCVGSNDKGLFLQDSPASDPDRCNGELESFTWSDVKNVSVNLCYEGARAVVLCYGANYRREKISICIDEMTMGFPFIPIPSVQYKYL